MLPTTSSAASPAGVPLAVDPPRTAAESAPNAETAAKFEGLLWSSVLAPLSQALGPLGDVFTDALGAAVARGQHDAFYDELRALTERSGAGGAAAQDAERLK